MAFYGLRKPADKILSPFVRVCACIPLSANAWTLIGALLGIVVGFLFYQGAWIYGALLFCIRGLVDLVDGYVARNSGMRTIFGAIMDDLSDRWVLGVVYTGGCLYLAHTYSHILIICMLGLTGSLANAIVKLSVYAEAMHDGYREDGKIHHPIDPIGCFGSAEFLLYFGGGALLTGIFNDDRFVLVSVWIVCILSHLSLLQRIKFAWKYYSNVDPVTLNDKNEDV